MKPIISGVTVSVDMGDKDYGKGESCFMNMQGRYSEPGLPFDQLIDVVADGLDMYFAAWRTLFGSRYATGKITAVEFSETLAKVTSRIESTRRYLKNHDGPEQQQG
jgi:hypothetical protein